MIFHYRFLHSITLPQFVLLSLLYRVLVYSAFKFAFYEQFVSDRSFSLALSSLIAFCPSASSHHFCFDLFVLPPFECIFSVSFLFSFCSCFDHLRPPALNHFTLHNNFFRRFSSPASLSAAQFVFSYSLLFPFSLSSFLPLLNGSKSIDCPHSINGHSLYSKHLPLLGTVRPRNLNRALSFLLFA